jgi:hypothetical protein
MAIYSGIAPWRRGSHFASRKRAAPDPFGINVFCLDRFDPATPPIRPTEGAGMSVAGSRARSQ